ncbi:alpha/beta hydrolase [Paenibacillus luteus]|uniref:alpha/beta hydrolase n=1 Tax=Paenibacillus luteus TaxID=2545753 RepID=UPI001141E966|nr:alpha/beta hydrolase [Paenibacillus luteus]
MRLITRSLTNENVTLTAYLLDQSNEMRNTHNRPAILIFPGGAYRGCSDREAEPVAMAFLAEGYQAFVLRYSLNHNACFPKPLNDAEEALELIRDNSQQWGVDPTKVAVCGFSAGGHLASALGTMGRIRPDAMILGYPQILATTSSIFPSPLPGIDTAVDAATPTAFIFHTFEDTLVPVNNALALASALEQFKVPFDLHIFRNGVHGLSLAAPVTSGGLRSMVDGDAAKWFDLCISWLKKVFGEFASDQDILLDENISEYDIDVQLGVLLKNPACKTLIYQALPMLENSPQLQDALQVSIRQINEWGGEIASQEVMEQLNFDLKAIPLD